MKHNDDILAGLLALSAIAFIENEESNTEKNTKADEETLSKLREITKNNVEIHDMIRQMKHDIFKCQNVTMFNISANEPSKRELLKLLDKITADLMKLDERL